MFMVIMRLKVWLYLISFAIFSYTSSSLSRLDVTLSLSVWLYLEIIFYIVKYVAEMYRKDNESASLHVMRIDSKM